MTERASRFALFLGLGAVVLALSTCGYRLRGTGTFLPAHIKTVSVPMFRNLTTRFQLDLKLTQAVIDEIVSRGKVSVVTDNSKTDALLSGEILTFNVVPIGFTPGQATADRFNIIVVAKIILRDLVTKKVIFANPAYMYQEEYDVPQGTDFESQESDALDKIAVKFARQLVITILEGF
jgi:hypothetical protein